MFVPAWSRVRLSWAGLEPVTSCDHGMGAPASLCPAPFFFLWIAQSFVISAENSIVDSTYICGQSTPLLGSLSPGMADEGGERNGPQPRNSPN
jgi:hypothetical protein